MTNPSMKEILRLTASDGCHPDATPSSEKLQSDTPRMDATLGESDSVVFATGCQLERELAALSRDYGNLLAESSAELKAAQSATPERLGRAFDQALAECTGSILSQYSANLIRKRANAIVAADNRAKQEENNG